MDESEMSKRFLTKNPALIFDLVDKGEIVIGMCGHFFNWEGHLLPVSSKGAGKNANHLYQKLTKPFFEKLIANHSGKNGSQNY